MERKIQTGAACAAPFLIHLGGEGCYGTFERFF